MYENIIIIIYIPLFSLKICKTRAFLIYKIIKRVKHSNCNIIKFMR